MRERGTDGGPVAELTIDDVAYQLPAGTARLLEVEVEAKGGGGLETVQALLGALAEVLSTTCGPGPTASWPPAGPWSSCWPPAGWKACSTRRAGSARPPTTSWPNISRRTVRDEPRGRVVVTAAVAGDVPTIVQMDYQDAVDALYARMPTRMGPSLDRITRLAELLDHPERTAPAVHLTGTNGKTSTARMVASLLAAFGVGAGVYASPHLQDVRERVALATRPISTEEFAETWAYLEPFLAEVDRASDQPVTFYEALTILAFTWFAELPVDAQVVEVGMGGTWDATNLVDGDVAVVNRVSLDHPELGDTPAAVAAEKAGIIKRGATVVSQAQDDDVARRHRRPGGRQDARLLVEGPDFGVERRRWPSAARCWTCAPRAGSSPTSGPAARPPPGRQRRRGPGRGRGVPGRHEGAWGPGPTPRLGPARLDPTPSGPGSPR